MEDEEWEDVIVVSFVNLPDEAGMLEIRRLCEDSCLVGTAVYRKQIRGDDAKWKECDIETPDKKLPKCDVLSKKTDCLPELLKNVLEKGENLGRGCPYLYPSAKKNTLGYFVLSNKIWRILQSKDINLGEIEVQKPQDSWGIMHILELSDDLGMLVWWSGDKIHQIKDGKSLWTSEDDIPSPNQAQHVFLTDTSLYYVTGNSSINRLDLAELKEKGDRATEKVLFNNVWDAAMIDPSLWVIICVGEGEVKTLYFDPDPKNDQPKVQTLSVGKPECKNFKGCVVPILGTNRVICTNQPDYDDDRKVQTELIVINPKTSIIEHSLELPYSSLGAIGSIRVNQTCWRNFSYLLCSENGIINLLGFWKPQKSKNLTDSYKLTHIQSLKPEANDLYFTRLVSLQGGWLIMGEQDDQYYLGSFYIGNRRMQAI